MGQNKLLQNQHLEAQSSSNHLILVLTIMKIATLFALAGLAAHQVSGAPFTDGPPSFFTGEPPMTEEKPSFFTGEPPMMINEPSFFTGEPPMMEKELETLGPLVNRRRRTIKMKKNYLKNSENILLCLF